jgi:AraC family transcriptional regulator
MTPAGAYGQRQGQFLHLKNAPPSLFRRTVRGFELAATETADHSSVPGLSGQFQDAYLVSLKFRDYRNCE